MVWGLLIVVGCILGGVGLYELSTGRQVVRRPAPPDARGRSQPSSAAFVVVGTVLLVVPLIFMFDVPSWARVLVVVAALVVAVIAVVRFRPAASGGGHGYPPTDPENVFRRPP